jgi:5-methylcytosine-specific restriction endonuclease McrA
MERICDRCKERPNLAKGLCDRCYAFESYQKNREHKLALKRAWVSKNKEKVRAAKRNSALLRNYGITQQEYEDLLTKQQKCCKVCGRPDSGRPNMPTLVVDHCHKTNRIRGLLCSPCNVAIGMLQDSPTLLTKLKVYLETGFE